jgi:carboxymethylenebutenolidase
MQFHVATKDDWCNPQAIAKLEETMKRGNVRYELHLYEGTEHAFMNDARPEVYAPSASKLAWDRALKFLATNLSS